MVTRLSTLATVAVVAGLLLTAGGCSKINRENYDKVQPGMSIQQVKDILGSPDERNPAASASSAWAAPRAR